MPTTPTPGAPIVPLTHHLELTAGKLGGRAIALQFSGSEMLYLVAGRSHTAPVWLAEHEIETSHVPT